jgi:hypothetical protein
MIFNFFSHISATKMMFWALARVSFRAAKIVSCNKKKKIMVYDQNYHNCSTSRFLKSEPESESEFRTSVWVRVRRNGRVRKALVATVAIEKHGLRFLPRIPSVHCTVVIGLNLSCTLVIRGRNLMPCSPAREDSCNQLVRKVSSRIQNR